MDQKANILLRLIHSIKPITTEQYGLMIPYGDIYDNAEQRSLFPNTNIIDNLLLELKKADVLEIIPDPSCEDMILGIRLK